MGTRARVVLTSILVTVVLATTTSTQQLPSPTNTNLTKLGYFFVNERYGDDTAAVFPYTNLFIAIPAGYNLDFADWQTPFRASLLKAVQNNKSIYLIMTEGTQETQVFTWDAVLDVAQEFWGSVAYVEVAHEEPGLTASALEQKIARLNGKLDTRGLPRRPTVALFTRETSLTTNAIEAVGLSHVAIEAYQCGPGSPDPQVDVQNMQTFLTTAKNRVRAVNKHVVLVMMAYDRQPNKPECPMWTDMTRVAALQVPVYMAAYNDDIVSAITMFAYGRPGGSRDHPELVPMHREMGSELGISPRMSVDAPATGTTARPPFTIGGWAFDWAAPPNGGTGVDAVHVWAYPSNGQPPTFVGAATLGGDRADVAAAYGSAQFRFSGFNLTAGWMPPGSYTLAVHARSTVSGTFNNVRTVAVTLPAPDVRMNIDTPAANATVPGTFVVGGWAIDLAAGSGPGIDTVHVWAYPNYGSNQAPVFLGARPMDVSRPDVGAAFGPQFTLSGFNLSVSSLGPGTHLIVVYPHSTVSNAFEFASAKTVLVTVQ